MKLTYNEVHDLGAANRAILPPCPLDSYHLITIITSLSVTRPNCHRLDTVEVIRDQGTVDQRKTSYWIQNLTHKIPRRVLFVLYNLKPGCVRLMKSNHLLGPANRVILSPCPLYFYALIAAITSLTVTR